jgi:ABC-type Na+ efflux pump permease subunit
VIPAFREWNLTEVVGDPLYLASFVGYFLTGYLLFAAILVAIGSVCNSLKEAQNLLQPCFCC